MTPSLRPRRSDDLGLQRALSGRLLPFMAGAMAFLAALAGAGATAASSLASQWRDDAASLVTVQVPQPAAPATAGGSRQDAVAGLLGKIPAASVRRLDEPEIAGLLKPWLGDDAPQLSLLLPAVFELRAGTTPPALPAQLEAAAPGTLIEQNGAWLDRLVTLAASLRACAALALLVVGLVAACVVAMAARAGLAARRDAIEIVHGLGATDRTIAGQFAGRLTGLTFAGAVAGVLLALPVLLGLARLTSLFRAFASPGSSAQTGALPGAILESLPGPLWGVLPALPVLGALVAWLTTQVTVRRWLARLP